MSRKSTRNQLRRTVKESPPGIKMTRRARAGTLTQRNYGGVIGNYFQELTKRRNFAAIQERKNKE